jgi:hypothetical protein
LIAAAERSATFRKLLLERARTTARKRARLYAKPIPRALTNKQFEALRGQVLKFRDLIAASEADAIAPRAAAPAEIS